ncbi:beta-eliminating lyase [Choiromyces venosus 120613-1]|uniref:Beta-eliminating lyase n=1 Tax=Choiromyces venosus 120613-1 TaxID=1336337 RepID=A0A3N4J156_9PEZI|nr:beta-eliminating lyase [Choiromyces venosus 120613-1]
MSATTSGATTSSWDRSPAEFDFRSDTFTTPTRSMLASIGSINLGDDVYSECTTTQSLESRIASLLDKPSALFVLSGTMGNQLAMRALLVQPPHSILLDSRSHIQLHEAGGIASLSQAVTVPVPPSNGKYLTLEDVQKHVILGNDVHFAPTRVISLENTINGVIMPVEEVRRIGQWAKAEGIKVHLDGARLWNACSVPEPSAELLSEYAKHVDSLSVCFSKSLGAPVGSCMAADERTVASARHMRKAIGGGIRQAGILTAMARVGLEEVFFGGKLARANAFAKSLEEEWIKLGGSVTLPVDTNMLWLDLRARGIDDAVWKGAIEEVGGVRMWGDRIVCHYQNSQEAVEKVKMVMRIACKAADEKRANGLENRDGKDGKKVGERTYGQSN